jgi:hypothetical protein
MRARPPEIEGKGRPNKVSGFDLRRFAEDFVAALRFGAGRFELLRLAVVRLAAVRLAVVFLAGVFLLAVLRLAAVLLMADFLVAVPFFLAACDRVRGCVRTLRRLGDLRRVGMAWPRWMKNSMKPRHFGKNAGVVNHFQARGVNRG